MFDAVIAGNVCRDPEARKVGNDSVVNFTVAAGTGHKEKDGTYQTMFINVSAWGKTGERAMVDLKKGSFVTVKGRAFSNKYPDKNGIIQFSMNINADDIAYPRPVSGGNTPKKNDDDDCFV